MQTRTPLTTTIAVLLALPAAFAQAPDTTDAGSGEPIIITGSNIKRSDYEGPQAVAVYDSQRISELGVRSLTDLLQKLPQSASSLTEATNTGLSFSPGAAGISLRGLGVSSTLVLLNGRRVAPFPLAANGTEAFVDLNSIPLSAIERVEILKEGASAIYGSDAIAGVVNIILKSSYQGVEEETYYGNTTDSDSAIFRQSFTSGFSNERFHLFVTGNYYHRNPLADVDRSFSESANHHRMGGDDFRSSRSNPGTIFTSQGTFGVPRGSNGKLAVGDFINGETPAGDLVNKYDYNRDSELIPETERWGGLLTFGYNLTPHIEVFGEASYQSVQTRTRIAPTAVDSFEDNIVIPAKNPFNPFGEETYTLWRSVENGLRRDTTDLDSYRYLAGIKLKDLPYHWSAEAAVLYSESNVVDHGTNGFLSVAGMQKALNQTDPDKTLNVFGDGDGINSHKVLESLVTHPRTDGQTYIWNYDVKASGDLFKLPAGSVGLAVGAEYREESLSQTFSAPAGAIIGFGAASTAGDRDVRSAFYEVSLPVTGTKWNVPLLRALEFTIAQRYDDYSDFGDVAKPKFGFKWKPLDGVLFRGAYAEGFRAPSLPQLFTGGVSGFETVFNPRTGITTDVPVLVGGNRALQPETSYSYFLGTIIDPPFIKGLSIGADFFRIEQRNLIGSPGAQEIINGTAPGTVTYNANDDITNVTMLFANLGTVVVDGVDFDVSYKLDTKIGTFTFQHNSTFINSYETRPPGKPNNDLSDTHPRNGGAGPEFRMINSLFYKLGGFEAGVTLNYFDSYDDIIYDPAAPARRVGSWTTVDLQASYEWIYEPASTGGGYSKDGKTEVPPTLSPVTGWRALLNHTKLTLGVLNVGESQPPFSNIEEGYDTKTAVPDGRFVYASLRKKFW